MEDNVEDKQRVESYVGITLDSSDGSNTGKLGSSDGEVAHEPVVTVTSGAVVILPESISENSSDYESAGSTKYSSTDSLEERVVSPTLLGSALKAVKSLFSPSRAKPVRSSTPTSREEGAASVLPQKETPDAVDKPQPPLELGTRPDHFVRDSHNNTNDSYTTTVSRLDESFQSTTTHFEEHGTWSPSSGERSANLTAVPSLFGDNTLESTAMRSDSECEVTQGIKFPADVDLTLDYERGGTATPSPIEPCLDAEAPGLCQAADTSLSTVIESLQAMTIAGDGSPVHRAQPPVGGDDTPVPVSIQGSAEEVRELDRRGSSDKSTEQPASEAVITELCFGTQRLEMKNEFPEPELASRESAPPPVLGQGMVVEPPLCPEQSSAAEVPLAKLPVDQTPEKPVVPIKLSEDVKVVDSVATENSGEVPCLVDVVPSPSIVEKQVEVPNMISEKPVEVPNLASEKPDEAAGLVHEVPSDVPSPSTAEKQVEVSSLISEKPVEVPSVITEKPVEVSSVITETPVEVSNLASEKPAEAAGLVAEVLSDVPSVSTAEKQVEVPSVITEKPVEVSSVIIETPVEVSNLASEKPAEAAGLVAEVPSEVPSVSTAEKQVEVPNIISETPVEVSSLISETPVEVSSLISEKPVEVSSVITETPVEVSNLTSEKPAEAAGLVAEVPSDVPSVSTAEKQVEVPNIISETPVEVPSVITEKPVEVSSVITEKPVEVPSVITEKPVEVSSVITEKPVEVSSVTSEKPAEAASLVAEVPSHVPSPSTAEKQVEVPSVITEKQVEVSSVITEKPVEVPNLTSEKPGEAASLVAEVPSHVPSPSTAEKPVAVPNLATAQLVEDSRLESSSTNPLENCAAEKPVEMATLVCAEIPATATGMELGPHGVQRQGEVTPVTPDAAPGPPHDSAQLIQIPDVEVLEVPSLASIVRDLSCDNFAQVAAKTEINEKPIEASPCTHEAAKSRNDLVAGAVTTTLEHGAATSPPSLPLSYTPSGHPKSVCLLQLESLGSPLGASSPNLLPTSPPETTQGGGAAPCRPVFNDTPPTHHDTNRRSSRALETDVTVTCPSTSPVFPTHHGINTSANKTFEVVKSSPDVTTNAATDVIAHDGDKTFYVITDSPSVISTTTFEDRAPLIPTCITPETNIDVNNTYNVIPESPDVGNRTGVVETSPHSPDMKNRTVEDEGCLNATFVTPSHHAVRQDGGVANSPDMKNTTVEDEDCLNATFVTPSHHAVRQDGGVANSPDMKNTTVEDGSCLNATFVTPSHHAVRQDVGVANSPDMKNTTVEDGSCLNATFVTPSHHAVRQDGGIANSPDIKNRTVEDGSCLNATFVTPSHHAVRQDGGIANSPDIKNRTVEDAGCLNATFVTPSHAARQDGGIANSADMKNRTVEDAGCLNATFVTPSHYKALDRTYDAVADISDVPEVASVEEEIPVIGGKPVTAVVRPVSEPSGTSFETRRRGSGQDKARSPRAATPMSTAADRTIRLDRTLSNSGGDEPPRLKELLGADRTLFCENNALIRDGNVSGPVEATERVLRQDSRDGNNRVIAETKPISKLRSDVSFENSGDSPMKNAKLSERKTENNRVLSEKLEVLNVPLRNIQNKEQSPARTDLGGKENYILESDAVRGKAEHATLAPEARPVHPLASEVSELRSISLAQLGKLSQNEDVEEKVAAEGEEVSDKTIFVEDHCDLPEVADDKSFDQDDLAQLIQEQFSPSEIEKICNVVEESGIEKLNSQVLLASQQFDRSNPWGVDGMTDGLDFLDAIQGTPSGRDFTRESLYVKFDPLVKVAEEVPPKPPATVVAVTPLSSGTTCKPTPRKDKTNSSELAREIIRLNETYLLRERLNQEKYDEYEKQIAKLTGQSCVLEDKLGESESRERSLARKLQEQAKSIDQLKVIMGVYEKTIAKLTGELEKVRRGDEVMIASLESERDSYMNHLQNVEAAFTDVHSKYERLKKTTEGYRANEKQYNATIVEQQDQLDQLRSRIKHVEDKARSQSERSAREMEDLRREHEMEVVRVRAALRKKDLDLQTLQGALDRKISENKELTVICDDFISGKK